MSGSDDRSCSSPAVSSSALRPRKVGLVFQLDCCSVVKIIRNSNISPYLVRMDYRVLHLVIF